jgi:hypothetical protein
MKPNPYKYEEPLDPEKDRLICISRQAELNRLIEAIGRDEYCAVIGPGKIGKTTFLRQIQGQIQKESINSHLCHYADFENNKLNEEDFYRWLITNFTTGIPSEPIDFPKKEWEKYKPEFIFTRFLEKFQPEPDKPIILLFDKIERLPYLGNFLGLWRRIYHDRYHTRALRRYMVVVAGSVDLIAHTIGPNSPFNIAKKFYLADLSDEESEKLIEEPFKYLGIKIEKKAKEFLLSKISGHPQLLQQACYILVERAKSVNNILTLEDTANAMDVLLSTNAVLKILKGDIKNNVQLEELLGGLLNGKEFKFYPNKEFSLAGAGPIKKTGSNCAIRNGVYEDFIGKLLEAN